MRLSHTLAMIDPKQWIEHIPPPAAWVLPISFLVGGVLLGVIIEKLILSKIRKWTQHTKWRLDDVVAHALKGMPLLWLSIAGLSEALFIIAPKAPWLGLTHKILMVIILLSLIEFLARLIVGILKAYVYQIENVIGGSSIILLTTRIIIYLIGILVILQTLGISIIPIITALGVGGLAISLALQDTLGNFFAGLHILMARQILPGDFIKLDSGEEGYVIDVTWRNTIVEDMTENRIIIPNTKLGSAIVINYHKPLQKMLVRIPVGIHYRSDLDHVEAVTLDVAKTVLKEAEGAVADFEPRMQYLAFGDSSINFRVVLATTEFMHQYPLQHAFIKALHKRFNEEGITIPFPIRTLELDKSSFKEASQDTPITAS